MAKREMKTVKAEEQIVEETTVETPVVEVEEPKALIGVVTGCTRLNVRKKPNVKADVVKVIDAKDEVQIFENESNKEWYWVVTKDETTGFCMKKFITVK